MAGSFSKDRVRAAISEATKKLGYSELRHQQELVVEQFVEGRDVFVSLPTGSGKSLCYFIMPREYDILKGITSTESQSVAVVVSPLVALMKDQVRRMVERDTSAIYVGDVDSDEMVAKVCGGHYQLVYMSPEALLTNMTWRDMLLNPLYQQNMVAFVVDEAHCVKKWGETFRKEFSRLGEVRSLIPEAVNIMALTATASKTTRREVSRSLGLVCPAIVAIPPNKPNIKYCVKSNISDLEETFATFVEELQEKRTCMEQTIIFCRTYKDCAAIYMFMVDQLGKAMMEPISTCPDLPQYRLVDMFCACTHVTMKNSILQSIAEPTSTLRIVVATIAFGMGLDCPNIRQIIHWGPSSDVEMYLQETGRAVRDGQSAVATLYYTKTDLAHTTDDMKAYCQNQDSCRRMLLLKDFLGLD